MKLKLMKQLFPLGFAMVGVAYAVVRFISLLCKRYSSSVFSSNSIHTTVHFITRLFIFCFSSSFMAIIIVDYHLFFLFCAFWLSISLSVDVSRFQHQICVPFHFGCGMFDVSEYNILCSFVSLHGFAEIGCIFSPVHNDDVLTNIIRWVFLRIKWLKDICLRASLYIMNSNFIALFSLSFRFFFFFFFFNVRISLQKPQIRLSIYKMLH